MNVVFCDKRDCLFWDVDGICNCVMHDGIPYCKSESIDTKNDAADGLKEENSKLRELCEDMNKVARMFCEAWEGSCSKEAEGMSLHAACPIGDTSELCVFGKLHDRMRELGIEA